MTSSIAVGLFVGGRGTRMGGVPKGNLELASGERLITRLAAECRRALPGAPLVLVGAADAYADLGLRVLTDSPSGVGPLGGLRALLHFARESGYGAVLALACDLPYLEASLVKRLAEEAPDAVIHLPRGGERWQTLVARYSLAALDAVEATLGAGEHALQRVVARLGEHVTELAVDPGEARQLRDWDTPSDRRET